MPKIIDDRVIALARSRAGGPAPRPNPLVAAIDVGVLLSCTPVSPDNSRRV
jgi:hypothetical protein